MKFLKQPIKTAHKGLYTKFTLDLHGICASAGSACSSGSSNPSHVLTAIGLSPEEAHSSLRISFGEENTKEDVDYLVNSIVEIIEKLTS